MSLKKGNEFFRAGEYDLALIEYNDFIEKNPQVELILNYNIRKCIEALKGNVPIRKPRSEFHSFGQILHYPLVSIIIVSYNSTPTLSALFDSILHQSYKNIEVVFVENGTDNTELICKNFIPGCKYIKCNNVGFAEGNNIGAEVAKGELLFLLNPDARIDIDCINELVSALRYDSHAAIAAPKIYFYRKFLKIKLSSCSSYKVSVKDLLKQLDYKKHFIREGTSKDGFLMPSANGVLEIDISCEDLSRLTLKISTTNATKINVVYGYKNKNFIIDSDCQEIVVDLDKDVCSSGRYIVNNAGSGFNSKNEPYDRGFGEYDEGQYYTKTYLSAFCGCAALIRRVSIIDRPVFTKEFFAYFEDTELSWYLLQNNQKILYVPTATVYHKHSESTEENSPVWTALVSRSRYIFDAIKERSCSALRKIDRSYEGLPLGLSNRLLDLDMRLNNIAKLSDLISNEYKSVCIYNSYFNTLGGGERHCLSFIKHVPANWKIYLLSENDFSISNLEVYFDMDLTRCIKIVSTTVDTFLTQRFDLFINSTYNSNLIANAQYNFYIVSFPHKEVVPGFVDCYKFLHNSNYTKRWALEYWGEHIYEVIEPVLSNQQLCTSTTLKEKIILNVGRFNFDGHCKNQHLILKAFLELLQNKSIDEDWKLLLVGGCDYSSNSSIEYLDYLKKIPCNNKNVIISVNESRENLQSLYSNAFIYVHATGLGCPIDEPSLHEHYGITVYEAMLAGCYPIVYSIGGPAEQIVDLNDSRLFSSSDELKFQIIDTVKAYGENDFSKKIIDHACIATQFYSSRASDLFHGLF